MKIASFFSPSSPLYCCYCVTCCMRSDEIVYDNDGDAESMPFSCGNNDGGGAQLMMKVKQKYDER